MSYIAISNRRGNDWIWKLGLDIGHWKLQVVVDVQVNVCTGYYHDDGSYIGM